MTPEQLDDIEARADAAKSVTGDDIIESGLAWAQDWESMTYDVTRRDGDALLDHARCVAEETAELVIHAPDDIKALVAEVRRLQSIVEAVRDLHSEGTGTAARYNHDETLISVARKPTGRCSECSRGKQYIGCCKEDDDNCDGPHVADGVRYPCATRKALEGTTA